MMQSLDQLLADCTVKLAPSPQSWGTGFFVAPGQLLTCAHVVAQRETAPIPLWWRGQEWGTATITSIAPEPLDLALLQVQPFTAAADAPPCVWLEATVHPQQDLYLYGYPDQFPEGAAATVTCEGTATQGGLQLIKFKLGQIRPGFSGSPLLNLATGKVCGLVIETLDRGSNLGGLALSTTEILACYPEVQSQSLNFHRRDRRWQIALSRAALVQTAQQVGGAVNSLGQLGRDRGLLSLLKRVQSDHIDLPLQNSLFNLDPLTLDKVEQPQAVLPRWQQSLLVADPQAVTTEASIEAVWASCGGKLLILGQPGAGKSTTLLMLAQTLVNQAFVDSQAAIPVLFNLASWSAQQPLAHWIVQELDSKYGVNPKRGRDWLEQRQLIPLLDGLDEHRHPGACVEAINTFLADSRFGPDALAVCSRREEYHQLSTQLHLNGAILLQPLSWEQISTYLGRFPDLVDRDRLMDNAPLLELLRSPLLLSVTAIAWRTLSLDHLAQLTTPEAQQQYLWQSYLERMLDYGERQNRDRPRSRQFPDPAQTQHWLTQIAQNLTQTSQTDFLIERLQATWYPASLRQRLDGILGLIKVIGTALFVPTGILLLVMLMWGLFMSGIDQIPPATTLTLGLAASLGYGLMMLSEGLNRFCYRDIRLAEALQWSWPAFRQGFLEIGQRNVRLLRFLCWGILKKIPWVWQRIGFNHLGLLVVFSFLATPVVTIYALGFLGHLLWQYLAAGSDLFLISASLMLGLIIWCCLAIPKGIQIAELDHRILPGEGLHRNTRSILIGFSINLVRVLLVWIFFIAAIAFWGMAGRGNLSGSETEDSFSLIGLLLVFPSTALVVWTVFTVVWALQHYGGSAGLRYLFLRCLLTKWGVLPWNCARFLHRATELRLMQRIGGRYRFIHRTFQDYLVTPGDRQGGF